MSKTKIEQIDITRVIEEFKFKSKVAINFCQIDALGVLYNIQYLNIFENARLDYLKNLGLIKTLQDIVIKFPVMTVHHSIDYYNFAEFGDDLTIFTRVSTISNSSLTFENLAFKEKDVLLAKSTTIYVYIDPKTKQSRPIPEEIKYLFSSYEKGNVKIISKIK